MMITMAIIKLVYVAHIRNILEDIAETVEELYGEAAYEEEWAYIQGEEPFKIERSIKGYRRKIATVFLFLYYASMI